MTDDPKPCPFCGGEAKLDGDRQKGVYIICKACGAAASTVFWNTRPVEEEERALGKKCHEKLCALKNQYRERVYGEEKPEDGQECVVGNGWDTFVGIYCNGNWYKGLDYTFHIDAKPTDRWMAAPKMGGK